MNITQIANNQMKVRTDKGLYFQSYDSVVACIANNGIVTLGSDYRYSKTTMKYLIRFLGFDSIKEVDKGVSTGDIEIDSNLKIQ